MFVKANISVGFLSLKKNRNVRGVLLRSQKQNKTNKQNKNKNKKNSFPPILRTNSEQEICIQKDKTISPQKLPPMKPKRENL